MAAQADMWLRFTLLSLILLVAYLPNPSHGFQGDCPMNWTEAGQYNVPAFFYQFLQGEDSVVSRNDDGSSPPIPLAQDIALFGRLYGTLWVNTNGVISARTRFGTFTPRAFPINGPLLLAPFWADVDTRRNNGRIYYRETTNSSILCRFSREVQRLFSNFINFRATSCFIATWHNVTYFGGSSTSPVNSFQAIIGTNGRQTFVLYKYGNITWTTGTASGGNAVTGLGGTPAQVGFNSGNLNNYFAIDESRTAAVVNIDEFPGNTGRPGCWLFRTDLETVTGGGCNNTGGSLSVGPRYGKNLGGKRIYITGPCFNISTDVIVVKFDNITVLGVIEDEQRAYCFTPLYNRTGAVTLQVSTDNGTTFPFSTIFFFVRNDPGYAVTRQEPTGWFEQPYTGLRFTWDRNFFLPGALLDVDVVVYEEEPATEQGVTSMVVRVMPSIRNDGGQVLPTDLPFAESLEISANICAIRIKNADNSTLSEYLWSDVVSCERWFMAMVFEELDKRFARGDELSEREEVMYEQLVEALEQLNNGPTFGLGRKKRIIPLLGAALIRRGLTFIVGLVFSHCPGWIAAESISPTDFSDVFTPPCTLEQAQCDQDFAVDEACDGTEATVGPCNFFHNGASICYRSRPSSSGRGTQSCYDDAGNLITDPHRGGGTLDSVSAWDGPNFGHFFKDVLPYLTCCKLLPFLCDQYFRFRPTIPCTGYTPRRKGLNGGDPHIMTSDGLSYTFNPVGEFILIKVNGSVCGSLEVQGRFGSMEDNGGIVTGPVTVVTAVAIKVGENVLQVEPGPPSQVYMNIFNNYIFDDFMDVPPGELIQIMAGDPTFTFRRNSPGDIDVLLQGPMGCTGQFKIRKILASLLVTFALTDNTTDADGFRGNTIGLLGNFDGDANNDLRTFSGIVLPPNSSQQDIHNIFGSSYRLDSARSFLRYPFGMGFEDFNDERFQPAYINETQLLALTGPIEMCGNNVMCRFDYAYTRSLEFANGTLGAVAEVEEAARIYNASFAPCYGAPCGVGGECTEDGGSFQCSCDDNYNGTRCETIIDVCDGIDCQNNGVCRPQDGATGFACFCQPEFTGEFCEIPDTGGVFSPCGNSTCANGGTCFAADLEFTCICEEPYMGMRCEEVSDPCISFTCENGGRCISVSITEPGCECLAGFSGDTCENVDPANPCQSVTCLNGGTCYTDGATYTCDCRFGFTGLLCQSGTDVCLSNPCQNEGLCNYLDSAPGYECGCLAGFSGDFCEIVDPTNPCAGSPCLNGGTCYLVGSSIICDCTTGYTGDICQSVVGACLPNPCENEGICSIMAGYPGYECLCPSGFGGTFCQIVDPANPCQSTSCLNGGTCFYDGSTIRCNCRSGYTGQFCDAIEDNCSPNPCLNGGMCGEKNGPPGFQCACTAGYGGSICQNADPNNLCDNSPCLNGGTCFFDGSRITCGCRAGYTGNLCASVAVGSCSSYPCRNGGTCTNRYDSIEYDCSCSAGFVGRNCENVVSGGGCSTSPCENRGLCMNLYKNQYRCLCHAGFSGTNCQIDDGPTPCRSFPCQNGGLCNYGNGVYYCICSQGYFGNDCEIDQTGCEIRRCFNGGICRRAAPGEIRRCLCETGYTGQQCESDVICYSNPCENGGSCTVRNNVAFCECPEGFYGLTCHISNVQGLQALIVTMVSYGILAIVLLTAMVGLLCMMNRRRRVKPSSPGTLGPVRIVLRGNY